MELFIVIWFFVVGLFMGSFYGVVGGRIPNNESIISPRSHCYYCKHELKWYELIPVFSYIFQGGKCRNCKKSISVFYPITEILTGLLFAVSFAIFGFSFELAISLLIGSFFVIVLVSDITYLIIPDSFTVFFSAIVFIIKIFSSGIVDALLSLLSGVVMFAVMYAIMIIGNKMFKKETLGGADIKLMFFVGLVLSPGLSILVIFISSFIALPISLIILFKNKTNVIPFGPFLLLGLYLVYSFGIDYTFLQIV